jgi:hypothetical protein
VTSPRRRKIKARRLRRSQFDRRVLAAAEVKLTFNVIAGIAREVFGKPKYSHRQTADGLHQHAWRFE